MSPGCTWAFLCSLQAGCLPGTAREPGRCVTWLGCSPKSWASHRWWGGQRKSLGSTKKGSILLTPLWKAIR